MLISGSIRTARRVCTRRKSATQWRSRWRTRQELQCPRTNNQSLVELQRLRFVGPARGKRSPATPEPHKSKGAVAEGADPSEKCSLIGEEAAFDQEGQSGFER